MNFFFFFFWREGRDTTWRPRGCDEEAEENLDGRIESYRGRSGEREREQVESEPKRESLLFSVGGRRDGTGIFARMCVYVCQVVEREMFAAVPGSTLVAVVFDRSISVCLRLDS